MLEVQSVKSFQKLVSEHAPSMLQVLTYLLVIPVIYSVLTNINFRSGPRQSSLKHRKQAISDGLNDEHFLN